MKSDILLDFVRALRGAKIEQRTAAIYVAVEGGMAGYEEEKNEGGGCVAAHAARELGCGMRTRPDSAGYYMWVDGLAALFAVLARGRHFSAWYEQHWKHAEFPHWKTELADMAASAFDAATPNKNMIYSALMFFGSGTEHGRDRLKSQLVAGGFLQDYLAEFCGAPQNCFSGVSWTGEDAAKTFEAAHRLNFEDTEKRRRQTHDNDNNPP